MAANIRAFFTYHATFFGCALALSSVGGCCAWTAWGAYSQRALVLRIEGLGGIVVSEPRGPEWVRQQFPSDWLKCIDTIVGIHQWSMAVDQDLAELGRLSSLEELHLNAPNVTPAGLSYVAQCKKLRILDLSAMRVSDEGFQSLIAMTSLERLELRMSARDSDLEHLVPLVQLRALDLRNSRVSDEGVAALMRMKNLKELLLDSSQFTSAGIHALREHLPECHISY